MSKTRDEEINERAKEVASLMTADKDMQVAFADAIRRGAKWADSHPYIKVKSKN